MKTFFRIIVASLLLLPLSVQAEPPWQLSDNTRYMALGDSLPAGYGAIPATDGYVYRLYRSRVFDKMFDTLLTNAGVPGVTSREVLEHQVPQAIRAFQATEGTRPTFITLTVGGNDLLEILNGADPAQVLADFQVNLTQTLAQLRAALPNTRIYVSNLYTVPQIEGADTIVPIFNSIVAGVANAFGVPVADVYNEFLGKRGLLLINRRGPDPVEVHPTNAGHQAIARAFQAVIE